MTRQNARTSPDTDRSLMLTLCCEEARTATNSSLILESFVEPKGLGARGLSDVAVASG